MDKSRNQQKSSLIRNESGRRSPQDGIAFSAFGLPIGVRTNEPEIIPRLLEHIPPGAEPTSAEPERVYTVRVANRTNGGHRDEMHEVRVGQKTLIRTHNLTEALTVFESNLQLHVAEMCEERIFVHAGVVGWKGRALLIPGLSAAGKTTLVASLVQRGATYYSDEYAVLDRDGRVHPYSRPLAIRDAGGNIRIRCQPEALGGNRGVQPLPVGLIVVTRYRAGARWEPRILSPGQAVLSLVDNSISIRRQPQVALASLCRAVSNARSLESARDEAEEIVPLLFREMDNHKPNIQLERACLNSSAPAQFIRS